MAKAAHVRWMAVFVFCVGSATPCSTRAETSGWRVTAFVIGAPGRLDAEGDRRSPRFYQRADSAIAAYADIEEVQDPTWLQQEIAGYARRAVDCAGVGPAWCRRDVEPLGAAHVIHLTSGAHAELVWRADGNRAVRWTRIVATHDGTMTMDAPPAEFAAQVLAAFPSRLAPLAFDAAADRAWAEGEVDRLLYYIDQVVAALTAVPVGEHRRYAARFIEDGLAQIGQVRALHLVEPGDLGPALPTAAIAAVAASGPLSGRLAAQLEAVRAWRAGGTPQPCCGAQLASAATPRLTAACLVAAP